MLVDSLVFMSLILFYWNETFGLNLQFALELDLVCFLKIVKLKLFCGIFFGHLETPFQGHMPFQVFVYLLLILISSPFSLWNIIFCSCFMSSDGDLDYVVQDLNAMWYSLCFRVRCWTPLFLTRLEIGWLLGMWEEWRKGRRWLLVLTLENLNKPSFIDVPLPHYCHIFNYHDLQLFSLSELALYLWSSS